MTRTEYVDALATARKMLNNHEAKPLAFAFTPLQVYLATQRWNSASDEERGEANALNDQTTVN